MKRVIHKFRMAPSAFEPDGQVLPAGTVVAAGFQWGQLHVWVERDAQSTSTTQRIHVIGTGWEFDATGRRHLGSAMSDDFVWHIYGEVE